MDALPRDGSCRRFLSAGGAEVAFELQVAVVAVVLFVALYVVEGTLLPLAKLLVSLLDVHLLASVFACKCTNYS